jgi:hypothetical protein
MIRSLEVPTYLDSGPAIPEGNSPSVSVLGLGPKGKKKRKKRRGGSFASPGKEDRPLLRLYDSSRPDSSQPDPARGVPPAPDAPRRFPHPPTPKPIVMQNYNPPSPKPGPDDDPEQTAAVLASIRAKLGASGATIGAAEGLPGRSSQARRIDLRAS